MLRASAKALSRDGRIVAMERHTRSYLQLMKPGITLSNTMTAAAGYFLAASHYGFNMMTFLGVIGGVALIIGSACVVNNMTDRDLDAKMKRTKGRELAAGKIPIPAAAVYAAVLGIAGFWLLIAWTNWLTAAFGAVAYIWYVLVYAVAKRTTPLSTIIGGVCGALPPVAGYVAVTNQLDVIAWVIFGLMMVWQLPHFYAIAIFRRDDYKTTSLPVWTVRYGNKSAKAQIFFWVVVFALLAPLPTVYGGTGLVYLLVMMVVSIYWLYVGIRDYKYLDDERWARKMFGISLLVLLVLCAALAFGNYLP
jgi:protoheme IX farnesyltransferase